VSESPETAPAREPRVGSIAVLLAGSVALSRVIGYVREVVLAGQLGVGPATDAYAAAFTIPDVLNYLLAGGALTIAFVPFFTRTRRAQGEAAAQRLFEVVLGTTALAVVAATALLFVAAPPLVRWLFEGFDAPTQALTVRLTRILLPAQIFFVTGGILRAVLMVEGRFLTHALAPLVYNAAIIAGGLWTGTAEGFAWGALVGACLGPFLLPWLDLRRTRRVALALDPFGPTFRAYAWIALPLMLGFSLTTVDEWYEKLFGQALATGTVAVLAFARRLVQVPIAVVGQAIGVAALPTLSRLWSEGRSEDLDRVLSGALRAAIGLGVLSAAFLLVFAEPVVDVVYRRGAFGAEAAARVSAVLAALCLAVPAWVAQQVGVRAFYAREEMWRAMALGTALVVAAIPLYALLRDARGAVGLALAGAIAMSVNALVTLGWARARFGGPRLLPLGGAFLRALAIAAPAALTARALAPRGSGQLAALLEVAVGGAAFAVLAGAGVLLFGDEATRASLRGALRRRSAQVPDAPGGPDGVRDDDGRGTPRR